MTLAVSLMRSLGIASVDEFPTGTFSRSASRWLSRARRDSNRQVVRYSVRMGAHLGKLARALVGSVLVSAVLVVASCGDSETSDTPAGSSGASGGPIADSAPGQDGSSSGNPADSSNTTTDTSTADSSTGPLAVTSTAYMNGQTIPTKYECASNGPGMNVSPPLAWSGGPAGTLSYAIVMRDLDYLNGFIHWVIWDIPATNQSVPEDIEHTANPTTPAGSKQANFNGSITGYQGPCSPGIINTYEITLYAIPTATIAGITPATAKADAAAAIVNAATATAKLAGES